MMITLRFIDFKKTEALPAVRCSVLNSYPKGFAKTNFSG
jgi:hypothetical protein